VELRENTRTIAARPKAAQPKNTAKILQREWKDWCTMKGYDDADTVSEGKSSVRNPGHRGAEAEAGRQARLESERSSKRRKGRSSLRGQSEASIDSEAADDGEDTIHGDRRLLGP
jgi:hypothetical protein